MGGFCFSEIGKEVCIEYGDGKRELFMLVRDYGKKENMVDVGMKEEDYKLCGVGVKEVVGYGVEVVMVEG